MFQLILDAVSNPVLAYALLMIGIYGLFLECFAPGLVFPSLLGGIALCLSIYGLYHLPVNLWALALLLIGLALMMLEVFTSFWYLLGISGIMAFVFGSLFLIEPLALPGLAIGCVTLVTSVFFLGVLRFAMKVRKLRVVSGEQGMIGQVGVMSASGKWVWVMGERWRYSSEKEVTPGQSVRVLHVDGLVLSVELISEQKEK
jgi:membrane-bound serine protease (ClpP class)